MTSNGKNGENGFTLDDLRPGSKVFKESLGLGVAELVSTGVSLGVVGVADKVAPVTVRDSSRLIGKLLLPYLDSIEKGLSKVCKLDECQPDLTQSRDKRAEAIGKTVTVFSAAFLISLAAKLATRRGMNWALGVGPKIESTGHLLTDIYHMLVPRKHDLKVVLWDEGIHIGSLLLLNTTASKHTENLLHGTTHLLEKCGIPENKAKELSSMAVIWELPNVIGWAAGVGAIAHDHYGRARAARNYFDEHGYPPDRRK